MHNDVVAVFRPWRQDSHGPISHENGTTRNSFVSPPCLGRVSFFAYIYMLQNRILRENLK